MPSIVIHLWHDVTDVCSASDGKQLNICIGPRNFFAEYRNIAHRSFYLNRPFSNAYVTWYGTCAVAADDNAFPD